MSITNKGVIALVITVSALEVLTIFKFHFWVFTSQVHHDPKLVAALSEKSFLNFSKLQKSLSINFAIFQLGFHQALGHIQFQ
jgi:hypothetical protein